MPSKIQRAPPGFLAALSSIGTGDAPSVLPDTLAPTFPAEQFYLPRLEVGIETNAAQSAVGGAAGVVIPDSEHWWVRALCGRATMSDAGGICHMFIGIAGLPVSTTVGVAQMEAPRAALAAGDKFALGIPLDIIVPPGSVMLVQLLAAVTTGTADLAITFLFNRIRAG